MFQWDGDKDIQRKAEHFEEFLYENFLNEGHNELIWDIEIIFLGTTDPSNPTRREDFWKTKLRTHRFPSIPH